MVLVEKLNFPPVELWLQEQLPRDRARGQHDVPQRVPDEVRVAVPVREGGDGA